MEGNNKDNKDNKDFRRQVSLINYTKYHESWEISHKYTKILMKSIDHNDLYSICSVVYGQYMNELRNKKLNYKDSKNYVQIWNTMMNTVLKNVNSKSSVRLLHQTSQQRCYKKI